jgi:hypothetical protein
MQIARKTKEQDLYYCYPKLTDYYAEGKPDQDRYYR